MKVTPFCLITVICHRYELKQHSKHTTETLKGRENSDNGKTVPANAVLSNHIPFKESRNNRKLPLPMSMMLIIHFNI